MKTFIRKTQLARVLPKFVGLTLLVAMLLVPGSWALAGSSNAPDVHGIIEVIKFEDLNGDGVWQQSVEPVLSGWTFDLAVNWGGTWVYVTSGTTDATGHTTFPNLQPGTYKVTEQMQPEYQSTTGLEQTVVSNGETTTLYFGNRLWDVDFGDLPNTYGMTLRTDNGARSKPSDVFLGSELDTELDGLPNANASGDDLDNVDDEDGILVVAVPPDYWKNGTGTVQVTVTGGQGCLFAWMDVWNSNATPPGPGTDGDFDDFDTVAGWSEAVIVNRLVNPGTQTVSFSLPVGAAVDTSVFARFRIVDAVQGECISSVTPDGYQDSGEVEDYQFNFDPTAISLASFTAQTPGVNPSLAGLIAILVAAASLLVGSRILAIERSKR